MQTQAPLIVQKSAGGIVRPLLSELHVSGSSIIQTPNLMIFMFFTVHYIELLILILYSHRKSIFEILHFYI